MPLIKGNSRIDRHMDRGVVASSAPSGNNSVRENDRGFLRHFPIERSDFKYLISLKELIPSTTPQTRIRDILNEVATSYVSELLLVNTEGHFTAPNHPLVQCSGCRVDVLAAVKHSMKLGDLTVPLLIVELLSPYESDQPLIQLELKLVVHCALIALLYPCDCDMEVDEFPVAVYGVALPELDNPGGCFLVKVEWDGSRCCYVSTAEEKALTTEDDLRELFEEVFKLNEPLLAFLRERLMLPVDLEILVFREMYYLNPEQLRDLNEALGGDHKGTYLVQYPSLEALVFVRRNDAGENICFFKTSKTLPDKIDRLRQFDNLPVVLPSSETVVGFHVFFAFRPCTPFGRGDVKSRIQDVVQCLGDLHGCNVAHCDVRHENLVKDPQHDDGVRLIDLDRTTRCTDGVSNWRVESVWGGKKCTTVAELDWFQLGLSYARDLGIETEEDLQKKIAEVKMVQEKDASNVTKLLRQLLVEYKRPNQETLDAIAIDAAADRLANLNV